jgi:hypothetical protein
MPDYARKTKPAEVSPESAPIEEWVDAPVSGEVPPRSAPTERPVEAPPETAPVEPLANGSPESAPDEERLSIEKPKGSGLARFKSTNLEPEKVETLLTGLPHYPISAAKDWVRLHPDEATHWSDEYCFVNVPVQGQKDNTLHLVTADLARKLPPGRVQKFRLALASKPHDVFFLAHVPSRNLDNEWNRTNLQACEQAKKLWTMVASQREKGIDGYQIDFSLAEKEGKKPFPDPQWPKEALDELIEATFADRMILSETGPAWQRLVGGAQKLS